MTAVRAYQKFVVSVLVVFGLAISSLAASELSDSMQLFHQGDYENAYKGLTSLVQEDKQDARIYYYRGLISLRTGHRDAAARDFQLAMQLEAAGAGQGVGESLQRIQGQERLILEKYRTMARLAGKQRVQPVSPPAIQRSTQTIQLVRAESPINMPTFRLASEVPIRKSADDPFKDGIGNILADDAPAKPVLVSSPAANDVPVGTGLASNDETDDIFGSSDNEAPMSSTTAKPATVLGAVFRAVTKAAMPKFSTDALPPGIVPGMPGPGGEAGFKVGFEVDLGDGEDPFGESDGPAIEDADSEEEDPFGDF